jgi:hypothetical protein
MDPSFHHKQFYIWKKFFIGFNYMPPINRYHYNFNSSYFWVLLYFALDLVWHAHIIYLGNFQIQNILGCANVLKVVTMDFTKATNNYKCQI